MSVQVELTPAEESWLRAAAGRAGQGLDALVAAILRLHLPAGLADSADTAGFQDRSSDPTCPEALSASPSHSSRALDSEEPAFEAFHRALQESGLVKTIKHPNRGDLTEYPLVRIAGKPLSETVVEDRR